MSSSDIEPHSGEEVKEEHSIVQNYYRSSVVKWCFPFKYDLNKSYFVREAAFIAKEIINAYNDRSSRRNGKLAIKHGKPRNKEDSNFNFALLVADNFFYLTDVNIITRIDDGITDCLVFMSCEYLPSFPSSLLLAIQRDGTLMSIIPQHGFPLQHFQNRNPNFEE